VSENDDLRPIRPRFRHLQPQEDCIVPHGPAICNWRRPPQSALGRSDTPGKAGDHLAVRTVYKPRGRLVLETESGQR